MTTIIKKDIGRLSLFDMFGMLAVGHLSVQERSNILNYLKEEGFSGSLINQNIDRVKNNSLLLLPQHSQQDQIIEENNESLITNLRQQLDLGFLKADAFYSLNRDRITTSEYDSLKSPFIKDWIKSQIGTVPDNEQSVAIGETIHHTQVIARAGSGKTSTIVNRAYFLQRHCNVAPSEIMLLAFNRKAANEIAERLEKLCGTSIPHVMTFHALARAIVNPKQELIYNDSAEENQGLDSVFGDVIKDRLSEDAFLERVRKLMIAQFKDDWDEIVEGGYDLSPEQLYRYQKNLARETLRGGYVKSHGEKVIANFLFEHGIPYIYEKTHYIQGKACHPDFTIMPKTVKSKGVVLEYFGLAGIDPEYDKQMEEKRQHWVDNDAYEFIELTKAHFKGGEGAFEAVLKKHLENLGIECKRLSDEEIWQTIKLRATRRFGSAMSGFVGRCRKAWILPDDLGQMIANHESLFEAEEWFLELAVILYNDYLERLEADNQQDFDGLMQMAASLVQSGNTTFSRRSNSGDLSKLRYIFVDEYQDFSELFHRLMEAVRLHNPTVKFFCVGDDWQAINGFAGSDLKFYENFDSLFPQSRKLHISTNYRSVTSVVAVGNALMSGYGKPAVANSNNEGIVRIVDLANFSPTLIEIKRFERGILTPVILRLAGKALGDNKSVVLLTRRKELFLPEGGSISIDEYLSKFRKLIPEKWRNRITISTAHSFKGREGDVVIILDAFSGNYPLIHPNWIFARILGESIQQVDDENRRLFYVALTRAKENLFIITETGKTSPYLEDISEHIKIPEIDWDKYPPVIGATDYFVVRISGSFYELTDEFKADGYQFRRFRGKPVREKLYQRASFSIQMLHSTPWSHKAVEVPENDCEPWMSKLLESSGEVFDVCVLDENDRTIELYSVSKNGWAKQSVPAINYEDADRLVVKSEPKKDDAFPHLQKYRDWRPKITAVPNLTKNIAVIEEEPPF